MNDEARTRGFDHEPDQAAGDRAADDGATSAGTKPTTEADEGQGAAPPRPGQAGQGGPERRSGRIVMRRDAASRLGKLKAQRAVPALTFR